MATNFWDWKWKTWHILVIALIGVAIYFAACHKKNDKPSERKYVPEQKEKIVKDSAGNKRILDSMQRIINFVSDSVNDLKKDRKVILKDMAAQSDIINELLNRPVDDPAYRKALKDRVDELMYTANKSDSNCNGIIAFKDRQLELKDKQISQKDSAWKDLKRSADTCLKNQTAMEKTEKKYKPKRGISVGGKLFSTYNLPLKANIGVEIGYKNKKGTEYNAGIYTGKRFSIGVKKTIFSF